jgi:transcriptional regulator with XRE-family HTH domain
MVVKRQPVNSSGCRLATIFGDRLREERQRFGLNQIDFGEWGGVTKSAQLNYEKGERSPDADYLMALMARGVDVHYLLTGVRQEHAGSTLTSDQGKLLALLGRLDEDDLAVAWRVLHALEASKKG